jgi:integrase
MANNLNTITPQSSFGVVCMKGSIFYDKDRMRWAVSWYWQGRPRVIRRYKGEFMYHEKIAQKCLAMIQGRYEQYQQGLCSFRIEEFTGKNWTDIEYFFKEWMQEVIEPNKKPATINGYKSYWKNWLGPFFTSYPVMLHEIQLDTLVKLKNSIKNSGKGQYNIMNCLHSMMDYAFRSNRIPSIPPFPRKSEYDLKPPDFKWVTENNQMKIIKSIPKIHRPIFLWLKYHYRRPSEACALNWSDYDVINQIFTIRRTFSGRDLVESTKTREIHHIPCDDDFLPVMKVLVKKKNINVYSGNSEH